MKVPAQQWRPCSALSAQVHGTQLRPEQNTLIITLRTYKTNNNAETTETTHKTRTDSARAASSTRRFFARCLAWSYKHVRTNTNDEFPTKTSNKTTNALTSTCKQGNTSDKTLGMELPLVVSQCSGCKPVFYKTSQ